MFVAFDQFAKVQFGEGSKEIDVLSDRLDTPNSTCRA